MNIFGSYSEIQVDKEKYISRLFVLRLSFLLVLLGSAIVFDVCHDDVPDSSIASQQNTASSNFDVAHVFYFNPVNSFKVTTRANKLLSCILYSANQDEILSRFHNYRTFHLLKDDSLKDRVPFHLMAHFIKFTAIQYSSPDDYHSFS